MATDERSGDGISIDQWLDQWRKLRVTPVPEGPDKVATMLERQSIQMFQLGTIIKKLVDQK